MTRHHAASATRLAAWLGVAILAGCAPAEPTSPPPDPTPLAASTRFDGSYQGMRMPDAGCGFAGPVGYQVAGGSIWQPMRGGGRAMAGAIGATGRFRMADDAGNHVVVGTIAGDHLTAIDAGRPPHHKHEHSDMLAPDAQCYARIDARRVAPGRAD